jgi:hypothetical protein
VAWSRHDSAETWTTRGRLARADEVSRVLSGGPDDADLARAR